MTDKDADGADVQARLEGAAHDRRQREGLLQRLESAIRFAEAAEERFVELRARLGEEERDVDRLESLSLARLWASVKGSRSGDIEREAAERDAARYAVAEAKARLELARRDVDSVKSSYTLWATWRAGTPRR